MRCDALVDFLKSLLIENLGVEVESEEEWGKIFLFGIFEKRKRADICLINIVLSSGSKKELCTFRGEEDF